jgi:hypothetical protein
MSYNAQMCVRPLHLVVTTNIRHRLAYETCPLGGLIIESGISKLAGEISLRSSYKIFIALEK